MSYDGLPDRDLFDDLDDHEVCVSCRRHLDDIEGWTEAGSGPGCSLCGWSYCPNSENCGGKFLHPEMPDYPTSMCANCAKNNNATFLEVGTMHESENIELHNTETRINPSGHKELVKKKKGKPDEETLNELAREIAEQIANKCPGCGLNCQCRGYCPGCANGETGPLAEALAGYDDLPDDDEFEDNPHCEGCGVDAVDLLFRGGSTDIVEIMGRHYCKECLPDIYTGDPAATESIQFAGPLPTGGGAGSPEQLEYNRKNNMFGAPEAPTQTGAMERAAGDSLSNMTAATPMAADGPEEQKVKANLPASARGNPRRRKNNTGYTGDGIDYGATHSESFTGTGAIAIAPNVSFQKDPNDDEDDDDTDTKDTSESLMTRKQRTLNEWEPPFEAGGYDPGDYQMPSPGGEGVAKKKAKQDKVGSYDTDTSQSGKEWPRDHKETEAMGKVDDSGVDSHSQGSHESSVGDAKDGHQDEMGHNWPDGPKNDGGGVAEPFEGNRWSDGGTLSGGSGQKDMGAAKKNQSSAAGPGTITGTSGPQYGQPQEGWSPEGIGSLMEGNDVNVRNLFDNYARRQVQTSNIIELNEFLDLCDAYGCDAAINEQSLLHFMDANNEFMFYEGSDASGRYWVGQPLSESGKPWEDDDDEDCDDNEVDDDCVGEAQSRRPFSRTLSELQVRSPEAEVNRHKMTPGGDPDFGPMSHVDMEDPDPLAPDDYDEAMAGYKGLDDREGPGPMSNMADMPSIDDPDSMEFGAGDEFEAVGGLPSDPLLDYDPDEYETADSLMDPEDKFDMGIDQYPGGVARGRAGDDLSDPGKPGDMGLDTGYWDQSPDEMEREKRGWDDLHTKRALRQANDYGWKPGAGPGAYGESKVTTYTPKGVNALKAFIESAKSITSTKGDTRAIGQALTESWKYYAGNIDARTTPPQVQKTLKQLMAKYKTFSPLAEACSDMGGNQGKGGVADCDMSVSPDLAPNDQPGPDQIEDKGDPMGGKQKNTIGTPVIKGTGKGMSESLRRNVTKLAKHVKKPLAEAVRGIKGKYGMSFTVLVTEGRQQNRTARRSVLAEALVDVEELILLHGSGNVVLEAYVSRGNKVVRKFDVAMIPLKSRSPLVSEGKAIFRFNRTAQKFAETLVMEGITCRVQNHNWGNSVSAKASSQQAKKAFQMLCD
jgi:hypothetical protein